MKMKMTVTIEQDEIEEIILAHIKKQDIVPEGKSLNIVFDNEEAISATVRVEDAPRKTRNRRTRAQIAEDTARQVEEQEEQEVATLTDSELSDDTIETTAEEDAADDAAAEETLEDGVAQDNPENVESEDKEEVKSTTSLFG